MVKWTTNYLHETCKDLLLVVEKDHEDFYWDVEFLHRTVPDFLRDDRVRLVIEQQSPNHFKDPNFLVNLGKSRSVCLLHMPWKTCSEMENVFAAAIAWSRLSPGRHLAWLVKVAALMIDNHQQLQETCWHHESWHNLKWVEPYTKLELSQYLSALIVSQPRLAVIGP
jgi:hypothetical protein